MKKSFIIICAAALFSTSAFAQNDVQKAAEDAVAAIAESPKEVVAAPKPKYWKNSFEVALGVNNTVLENWAAGGYNTLTLSSSLDAQANYAKDLMSWNNRLQMDYAFLNSSDKAGIFQKSNDRLYLESKWAYKAANQSKWNYTASFDFRSQFTDTPASYSQDTEGNWFAEGIKSGFISPAYTNVALGLQWNPSSWFDINIAPLTGGFTICANELLRSSYGMKLAVAEDDPAYTAAVAANDNLGRFYKSALFQFGAQVKANFKFVINDNLKFESQAVAFTDYLNEPYVRINWDNSIDWQLSKYLKFAFKTWLISDPNVMMDDGTGNMVKRGVQFKEFLSFNFTYKIASK